jgi:hypothetical protein
MSTRRAARVLSSWWRAALCAGCIAFVTACGGSTTAGRPGDSLTVSPSSSASRPVADGDPAQLVGSWALQAAGEGPGAILTVGDRVDGGLLLFRSCGMLSGSWRANTHGLFVGQIAGGDMACYDGGHDAAPGWLDRVVGYRRDGSDALLVDDGGAVVARLTPGAHPTTGPNESAEFASPPVVSPDMRTSFTDPAPLPADVTPADQAALVGRWVPVQPATSKAYVSFAADNTYSGSDGCNGEGGHYVLGADGVALATSGGSTLVGCENSPLPRWIVESGRVGTREGRLVFVDPSGKVLGEAKRG